MTSPAVTMSRDADHVLTIRVLRPARLNAIDGEVARGIEAGLDELERDAELRVGILTGTQRVFSVGADLDAAVRRDRVGTDRGGFAGIVRRERRKPVIAAVEGYALGGGLEVVLACDLCVAGEDAEFGLPEVKLGIIAGAGGLFRLPHRIPSALAMEMALTGRRLDALTLHRAGLIAALAEPGQALDVALGLASEIAANGPLAVYASRSIVASSPGRDDQEGWRLTQEAREVLEQTADFREGPRAFLEMREPHWTGS